MAWRTLASTKCWRTVRSSTSCPSSLRCTTCSTHEYARACPVLALLVAALTAPGCTVALPSLQARATRFFDNLAGRIAAGGVFVCTIPDADMLVRRARNLPPGQRAFGNKHFKVEFDEASMVCSVCRGACWAWVLVCSRAPSTAISKGNGAWATTRLDARISSHSRYDRRCGCALACLA